MELIKCYNRENKVEKLEFNLDTVFRKLFCKKIKFTQKVEKQELTSYKECWIKQEWIKDSEDMVKKLKEKEFDVCQILKESWYELKYTEQLICSKTNGSQLQEFRLRCDAHS